MLKFSDNWHGRVMFKEITLVYVLYQTDEKAFSMLHRLSFIYTKWTQTSVQVHVDLYNTR